MTSHSWFKSGQSQLFLFSLQRCIVPKQTGVRLSIRSESGQSDAWPGVMLVIISSRLMSKCHRTARTGSVPVIVKRKRKSQEVLDHQILNDLPAMVVCFYPDIPLSLYTFCSQRHHVRFALVKIQYSASGNTLWHLQLSKVLRGILHTQMRNVFACHFGGMGSQEVER